MAENRITYIDLVKCIAIWLVLWGHAITEIMPQDLSQNEAYVAIYSFHMPLFMLVSGLFAEKSFSLNLWEIAKKKFMQLVFPSIAFFGICWWVIMSIRHSGGQWGFSLHDFISIKGFIKHEAECYWFLKSLFICYLLGWLCWRCKRYKGPAAFVILTLSLALQHWNITLFKLGYMFPFFIFGIWVKRHLDWIGTHCRMIAIITIITFIFGTTCYTLEYSFQAKLFSEVSIHSFIGYLYYLGMGLAGSMLIFSLCSLTDKAFKGTKAVRIISTIGTQTLGIYLWQKILLELLTPLFIQVELPLWQYNYILTPIVACVSLTLCYLITTACKRNRIMSIIGA